MKTAMENSYENANVFESNEPEGKLKFTAFNFQFYLMPKKLK